MSEVEDEEPVTRVDSEASPEKVSHGKVNPNFQGALNTTADNPRGLSENRRLREPLFLVFTLSITYIVMVYLALPLVINVVTTRRRIADGEVDPHTNELLATSISQYRYTFALTGMRLGTLLSANLIGALADVYGRKPLILLGVAGYLTTVVLYLVGWFTNSWECFLVGSIALGCVTPIIPIIIAVAADVASDPVASFTLHTSHVFGVQNIGLLSGMLVTVGLRVGLTNEPYFIISFALAGALSLIVFLVILCCWSETLPLSQRKPKLDWKLANPFGFLFVVTRNPYIFCIWAANCMFWISVGASEAVFANWWMLRYFITDTRALPLLWFLISTWIFSGAGQFMLAPVYLKLCGQKLLLHASILLGVAASIIVSYADTPAISYVGTSINFWASPGPPAVLALFLAQSDASAAETGAMTGVYRASQAGFRMIGSAAIGSYFADFITSYTPATSCVPKGYHPITNPPHSCDCGVKSCPINNTIWLPSVCAFGHLTPVASTQPGYTPVPTKKLLSMGITERCGTPFFDPAREITVSRAWCAGPDPWIGCRGLDVALLTRDGQVDAVMKACWGRKNITAGNRTTTNSTNSTILITVAPTAANTTVPTASTAPTMTPTHTPSATSTPTFAPTATSPTPGNMTNSTGAAATVNSTDSPSVAPTPSNTSQPTSFPFEGLELGTANVTLSPPQWLGGALCNATTMAVLKKNESAAFADLRAGKLAYSNQSLDPVRLNRSQSIYKRQGCPEEGDVTISLCRASSLGPRVEEPSMFMFFYPILAAYLFYLVAELFFRRFQRVPNPPPPQGLLCTCCKKKPVEAVVVPNRRGSRTLAELRRQSEGEVMLPQDPLATLKRERAWQQEDPVVIHQESPERPFTIHPPNID